MIWWNPSKINGNEDYYYEPIPTETPSNELEAKYERYLEDLYYDEEEEDVVPPELLEEIKEETPKSKAPKGNKRRRKKQAGKEVYDGYDKAPRRQHRQNIFWHKPYRSFLRSVSKTKEKKQK